jgi:hypothetical protein
METIEVNGKKYRKLPEPCSQRNYRVNFEGHWYEPIEENKIKYHEVISRFNYEDYPIDGDIAPIKSVRRLTDNSTYTVGEETSEGSKIEYMKEVNGDLVISLDWHGAKWETNIASLSKPKKQPLFTTSDGVPIYEEDEYPAVQKKTFDIIQKCKGKLTYPDQWVTFSTIEAANEWKLFNKPTLSLNDLLEQWAFGTPCTPEYFKTAPLFLKFKEAAKQNLKQ